MRKNRLWVVVLFVIVVASGPVHGQFFDWCGVLLPGQDDCLLFVPDTGWAPLVLEFYADYTEGDHVRVQGWVDLQCNPGCPDAVGCIDSNLISLCDANTPWEGNGFLADDSGCLLFLPANIPGERWILDEYGPFVAGDSVFVAGVRSSVGDSVCLTATGRVLSNLIEPWHTSSEQDVSTCGVLVEGTGCILLAAPAMPGGPLEHFELSDHQGWTAGDTICVVGHIPDSFAVSCPEASSFLVVEDLQPPPPGGGGYFEECGVLTMGSDCLLFASSSMAGYKLTLGHMGDFDAGDSVFVTGQLQIPSNLNCPDADGDLLSNTIAPCSPFGPSFVGDGQLVDSAGCILFNPFDEPSQLYLLDTYMDLDPGEIVHVNGLLNMGCESPCTEATGCIHYNIIIPLGSVPSGEMVLGMAGAYTIQEIVDSLGGTVLDSIHQERTYLVDLPDTLQLGSVAVGLDARPEVNWVHPNYLYSVPEVHQMSISFPDESAPVYVPNETPIEFFDQTDGSGTGLDSALMLSSGESVVVAVIDNGLDLDHPLFDGFLTGGGYDFLDDDADVSAEPGILRGHGTFVAGLIRLSAPNAMILPLRAFDSEGIGNSFAVAKAIHYAIGQGAAVVNMSFGMHSPNAALEQAVSDAANAGVLMVASVGNESVQHATYPAAYESVIAVSALDTLEQAAWFTNGGDYVDLCSPGVSLYSSLGGDWDWGSWSGTSFSAPVVTGAAALLLSRRPDLPASDVAAVLRQTARTDLAPGSLIVPDTLLGYGCIDAFTASLAYVRGDLDNSGSIGVSDLVWLAAYMFSGGDPPAVSTRVADVDCDGDVDISDVVRMTGFMFQGDTPLWPCIEP